MNGVTAKFETQITTVCKVGVSSARRTYLALEGSFDTLNEISWIDGVQVYRIGDCFYFNDLVSYEKGDIVSLVEAGQSDL